MCCEFMWIQKELMKCKLHEMIIIRLDLFDMVAIWSVQMTVTKKEMC